MKLTAMTNEELRRTVEQVHARIEELKESNPMLGHRGCRLGITYPEITEMQARAIFEAASDLVAEGHDILKQQYSLNPNDANAITPSSAQDRDLKRLQLTVPY